MYLSFTQKKEKLKLKTNTEVQYSFFSVVWLSNSKINLWNLYKFILGLSKWVNIWKPDFSLSELQIWKQENKNIPWGTGWNWPYGDDRWEIDKQIDRDKKDQDREWDRQKEREGKKKEKEERKRNIS